MENVKKRLAEIRERADKATPGPWEAYGPIDLHDGAYQYTEIVTAGDREPTIGETDSDGSRRTGCHLNSTTDHYADAELMAHSRTDVPALLELVEALIAERHAWNEYGDKGVGPYVEATDAALTKFGEGK